MFDNETNAQAFLHHLLMQHQQINAAADRAERAWFGELPASFVLDQVRRLQDIIQRHFREEDAGGCIDEAVARAPYLRGRAGEIESEHPRLLDKIQSIAERLGRLTASTTQYDRLRREFEEFVEELRRHEAAENQLLEEAFGIEAD